MNNVLLTSSNEISLALNEFFTCDDENLILINNHIKSLLKERDELTYHFTRSIELDHLMYLTTQIQQSCYVLSHAMIENTNDIESLSEVFKALNNKFNDDHYQILKQLNSFGRRKQFNTETKIELIKLINSLNHINFPTHSHEETHACIKTLNQIIKKLNAYKYAKACDAASQFELIILIKESIKHFQKLYQYFDSTDPLHLTNSQNVNKLLNMIKNLEDVLILIEIDFQNFEPYYNFKS